MGGVVSRSLNENLKKNQEFMQEVQRVSLERQIQMQNQIRERAVAMQIARARELFYWLGTFYVLATVGMIAGYRRTQRPGVLAPLLPLTFIVGYHGDMAYGNKLIRIRAEAENILQFETELTEFPCGLPSVSTIDQARLEQEENKKFHANAPTVY